MKFKHRLEAMRGRLFGRPGTSEQEVSLGEVTVEEDESSCLLPKSPGLGRLFPVSHLRDVLSFSAEDPDTDDACLGKWQRLEPPLGTWSSCVRYVAFSWNLLFSILGLLTLAVGVWGLLDKESLLGERVGLLGTDPMLFLALVGLAVSTLSLAGCAGALYANVCLLKFFTGGVLTFMAMELLGGLLLYALRHRIKDSLRDTMLLAVLRYQDDLDLRFLMDEIQTGLQCCGVESYRDWETNLSPGVQACGVPASCCLEPLGNGTIANSQCGFGTLGTAASVAAGTISLGGCLPQVTRWLNSHVGVIGSYFACLLAVEVGSLLLATKLLVDVALAHAAIQTTRGTSPDPGLTGEMGT
ncbi:tetraspanin-10 isoform X2 [Alligator sinensis]|uniref:Tetraspanin-10 isoform X2 n=1 Tax=Alligator sinensis TaxID=38654 RepID=A0A3Q0HPX6_ALLSI|nr:tetraspanin-10 isoform X2 [Alligator sinensis]